MSFFLHWIDTYGYLTLFVALMLEMLALPLPGELIMSYAGLQIFHGHLNWPLSILIAWLGTCSGMTLSYWIGKRLGYPFFEKHGRRVHMGPERLDQVSRWFVHYGNKVLIIAYFIPGVRHITGYFSGVTRIPLRIYMIYAYSGAFLWVGLFISLGKLLGPRWEQFHHAMTRYLVIGGVAIFVILLAVYGYRKNRRRILVTLSGMLKRGAYVFHSLRRLRLVVVACFILFMASFVVMVDLIQGVLANEFEEFDPVVSYIIAVLFDDSWSVWMRRFNFLSSFWVLLPLVVCSLIWVMWKSKDRLIEIGFAVFVLIGGELWEEGLRRYFHRTETGGIFAFPSEQTFITMIFLGFSAYLFVRHRTKTWLRTAAFLAVLGVSLLIGISRIYFGLQYPSDVIAGYAFGGVWLSLNIMLLEIFRILKAYRISLFT